MTPLALAFAAFAAWPVASLAQIAVPSAARQPGSVPTLAFTNADDPAIPVGTVLVFELAEPLQRSMGQLTVLIDGEDVGAFLRSADGLRHALFTSTLQLRGEPLLELVFEPRKGEPSRLLSTRLHLPAAGQAPAPVLVPPPASRQDAALRRKLMLQASGTRQSGTAQAQTLSELGMQLGLAYERGTDAGRIAVGSSIAGSTQRGRATIDAAAGASLAGARQVNLNEFLAEYTAGGTRVSLGSSSSFGHPLLGQSFDQHGLGGSLRLADRFDLSIAAQQGGGGLEGVPAVGFATTRRHIVGGTLGFEVDPEAPGSLRLELTGMSGREEPAADGLALLGAGTGERGHAVGGRVQWTPQGSPIGLEAGYARATSSGTDAFGTEHADAGRNAWYAEGAWRYGNAFPRPGQAQRSATVTVRHEFADAGFRSLAGGIEADIRRTTVGAVAQFEALQGQVQHGLTRSNPTRQPGLPVSDLRSTSASLSLPLALLVQGPAAAMGGPVAQVAGGLELLPPLVARQGSVWPTLLAGWQDNQQSAAPLQGDDAAAFFAGPARTRGTRLGARWSLQGWTVSLGSSLFHRAEAATRSADAQALWQALPTLSLRLGLRRSASDAVVGRQQHTGVDAGVHWQPGAWRLDVQASANRSRDDGSADLASTADRNQFWQVQASRQWLVALGGERRPVQLALRVQQQRDSQAAFSVNDPTAALSRRSETSLQLSTVF